MLCRWIDDEINVLSSHFPVSVNNVRSSLNTAQRKRKRKKSVDIIDLDLIEERRRKKSNLFLFRSSTPQERERGLIITSSVGAAERQVGIYIYISMDMYASRKIRTFR